MQLQFKDPALKVVVYCASADYIDRIYVENASRLGELLAQHNMECITGAGKQGLMGAINDAVLRNGGKATGIIPRFMVESGWCHAELNNLVITDTMHMRKAKMAELSDAVIALPGGIGTLEELAEILTWKQLGLYKKPIIILNTNNYYTPLLDFLEQMVNQNFMHATYATMWTVVSTPEEAMAQLKNFSEWNPRITKYDKKEL